MSNFTANFRLFHRKRAAAGLQPAATFRKDELALIEALESQRHRTGRVRAIIDDPAGQYPTVLRANLHPFIVEWRPSHGRIPEQTPTIRSHNPQFPIQKPSRPKGSSPPRV